eukprot:12107385-Ditylum_brightwellii.AAC.1
MHHQHVNHLLNNCLTIVQSEIAEEKSSAKKTVTVFQEYHGSGKFSAIVNQLTCYGKEPFRSSQDTPENFQEEIM